MKTQIKNMNARTREIFVGKKRVAEGMGVEFQSQHYEKQGYYFLA